MPEKTLKIKNEAFLTYTSYKILIIVGSSEGASKSRELMKTIREDPILWEKYNRDMYPMTYSIKLSEKQKCLIYGTLLGDGSIGMSSGSKNPLLQIEHSIQQEEYIKYKYLELSNLCKSKPTRVIHESFGKIHSSIRFQTRSLECLHQINNTVKNNRGIKMITDKWIDMISRCNYSSLALAMWYLDDGGITHYPLYPGRKVTGYMYFSCGDRSYEEVLLLNEWLKREFNIDSRIYNLSQIAKNGENHKLLKISKKKNMIKFIEIIKPWISQIPSMDYKTHLMYANCQ
jgi:hypothetical protein